MGTEELGHLEMIGAIVHQLTRNLKDSQIQDSAFAPYFVDHTTGVYPTAASGFPWSAASMQVKGDPIADLAEDLAAEDSAEYRKLQSIVEKYEKSEKSLRHNDFSDLNIVLKRGIQWLPGWFYICIYRSEPLKAPVNRNWNNSSIAIPFSNFYTFN